MGGTTRIRCFWQYPEQDGRAAYRAQTEDRKKMHLDAPFADFGLTGDVDGGGSSARTDG